MQKKNLDTLPLLTILSTQEIEVWIPHAIVRINQSEGFYTIVVNPSAIMKPVNFINLILEPFEIVSRNSLNEYKFENNFENHFEHIDNKWFWIIWD